MASIGRPSSYTAEYCDIVAGLGDEGEGMAEAIVACGISRDTFYRWQKQYPAFSDAVKAMRARSQAFWERQGRIATFGGVDGFNATSFIFNMKNRFPEDWKDKQGLEHSGPDGGPIETKETGAAKLAALLNGIAERSGTTGDPAGE